MFLILYFSFLNFPQWKATTYCKHPDLMRIITVNNLVIIRQWCVLMPHACYCMNPTPSSLLLTSLLCLAEQLKPDLSWLGLLPCKTWLHFHSETESDSCCPASSNVSSSGKTKKINQDKNISIYTRAWYIRIRQSSSFTVWATCTWLFPFYASIYCCAFVLYLNLLSLTDKVTS